MGRSGRYSSRARWSMVALSRTCRFWVRAVSVAIGAILPKLGVVRSIQRVWICVPLECAPASTTASAMGSAWRLQFRPSRGARAGTADPGPDRGSCLAAAHGNALAAQFRTALAAPNVAGPSVVLFSHGGGELADYTANRPPAVRISATFVVLDLDQGRSRLCRAFCSRVSRAAEQRCAGRLPESRLRGRNQRRGLPGRGARDQQDQCRSAPAAPIRGWGEETDGVG